MTDAEEFIFSLYEDVKELSCTNISQVVLVHHKLDKQFYIRRILPKDRRSVYLALKKHTFCGIPAIKELIYDGKTIVFEQYIRGTSLAKLMQNPISPDIFTMHMTALLEILHQLHSIGIIHRDLKEDNILIDADQQLFLLDFAIAKMLHSDEDMAEDTLGTISYAAPEQFGLCPTDQRSDLYSFGKICLNYLSCCPALSSAEKEMWTMIANKCLAFYPEKRYASAKEILEIIQQPALFYGSAKEHILPFLHTDFPPSIQIQDNIQKTVTHFYHADTITVMEQNGEVFLKIKTKHSLDIITIFEKTPALIKDRQSLTECFFLKDTILAVRMIYHPVTLLSGKHQKIAHLYQVRQISLNKNSSPALSRLYENLSGYSILGTEELLLDRDSLVTYPLFGTFSDFSNE